MGDIVVRIYYTNAKDELNANIYKIYSCDILDCMGIAISVMRVLAKIYIKCLLGWTQYKQSQWAIILIWLVFLGIAIWLDSIVTMCYWVPILVIYY